MRRPFFKSRFIEVSVYAGQFSQATQLGFDYYHVTKSGATLGAAARPAVKWVL